jgi:hypothetical protein
MVAGMFAWRGIPVTRVSSARQGVASGMNSGPLTGWAGAVAAKLSVKASTKSITRVPIGALLVTAWGLGTGNAPMPAQIM